MKLIINLFSYFISIVLHRERERLEASGQATDTLIGEFLVSILFIYIEYLLGYQVDVFVEFSLSEENIHAVDVRRCVLAPIG